MSINGVAPLRARGLRPVSELAAARPHGDRLRYMAGCRCDACRKANSTYECARQRARKAGDWNGIVPAKRARIHLHRLSLHGVGRRAVGAATDIADTVLSDIISGRKQRIRARTERLILGVTRGMASDRAVIPAARTHQLIADLLDEGYTEALIAKRLGYAHRHLQFGSHITARNAYRVERLHKELTE